MTATLLSTSTVYSLKPRAVAHTSSGRIWAWLQGHADLHYSDDEGGTWNTVTSPHAGDTGGHALFVDSGDNLYTVRQQGTALYFARFGNASGTLTARTDYTALSGLVNGLVGADIVAHEDPANPGQYLVHVITADSRASGSNAVIYHRLRFNPSGPSWASLTETTLNFGVVGGVGIDFHHTGDGRTVQGGAPHVFLAYYWQVFGGGSPAEIRTRKYTYSGGAYTGGTITTLTTGTDKKPQVAFDGTDWWVSYVSAALAPKLVRRDLADTTYTDVSAPATGWPNGLFLDALSLTAAGLAGAVVLFALRRDTAGTQGVTTLDADDGLYVAIYEPGTASWTTWARTSANHAPLQQGDGILGAPRSASAGQAHSVWLRAEDSGNTTFPRYWVHDAEVVNDPPAAPSLSAPVAGVTIDTTVTQRFEWAFSDPNVGDAQSAYDLRYRAVGGPTWTTVSETTPNEHRDFTAATFVDGTSYEWQVRTYDDLGTQGPWSGSANFTGGGPPDAPTITAPANLGTVSTSMQLVTWSTSEQEAYQLRTVADSGGTPDTGTVYFDTGTVVSTSARSRSVEFPVNPRTEHIQIRVRFAGIWSTWASIEVAVSYTVPPATTVTPSAYAPAECITITAVADAPTGGEPTPTGFDLFVRVAAGGTPDLQRKVGDDGIRIAAGLAMGASFIDYRAVGTRTYEYRAKVYGDNDTFRLTPWTA